MAKTVGPPPRPAVVEAPETGRWHVRTRTIRETSSALSGLWVRMAHRSAAAGPSGPDEGLGSLARGDPRIGAAIDSDRDIRVRTRTSVLTLVVVAPRPETVERAMAAVADLASRHPSRAIVISPADPDGPADFDAHVYASCQLPERGTSEICTEAILIRAAGELAQHLASTVAPLLIHDLPVVLWWPDDVPFDRPVFTELAGECDRLFVDSGQFRGDGLERLAGMAAVMHDGLVVHDVSWMRLMLWRELLASCFDHPLLRPELRTLTSIRIDVARPGRQVRLARAVLFAGWLMAMLRLSVVRPLEQLPDGSWAGRVRSGRREIEVAIHPVEVEYSGAVRSSGSLVRAEVVSVRSGSRTQVRVTRQADHLLATADWNNAQVARRATRLEPFDEVPYLAESLDRTAHDRVFARAVEKAVTLVGEAAGP
jgi:glucose-6-phosphate dehydrogenase assembly protein OpcA